MSTKLSQFWHIWLKSKEKYDKKNRTDVRYDVIKRYFKGKNLLDFCFGTGYFLKNLAYKGSYNLYGIDMHDFRGDLPKSVKTFFIKDLSELNQIKMPTKFDTILLSEVLEHLNKKEIRIVPRFLSKWLDEDGIIIISVPYKEDIKMSNILCPFCLSWFHPWLHKQSFDEKRLKGILKREGFTIKKINYITSINFYKIPFLLKNLLNFLILIFLKKKSKFVVWIVVIAKKSSPKISNGLKILT